MFLRNFDGHANNMDTLVHKTHQAHRERRCWGEEVLGVH